ncbi:MAG TPA: 4-alpha-glucanotransferase, partial [Thermoanaerobaculia bacterium]|nr:4-alpha-glucanotransferase [Thermoanaerobaculia bacterium]
SEAVPVTRGAGLLLHPTSLPSRFGAGDLGPEAASFLDWAARAGQSVWQVLPLGPTGMGNSPYGCLSAFAGNPLLVSPELCRDEGLLGEDDLARAESPGGDRVDFAAAAGSRERQLRHAFTAFRESPSESLSRAFAEFREAPEQATWLRDWALFAALKAGHGGRAWTDWDPELRDRRPGALAAAERRLGEELEYHRFVQFLFFRQWSALRDRTRAAGVELLGDLPIYVAADSADVWAHRELFELDGASQPLRVAGVPPDYFSATGQLWGNPLYRWDRLRESGYAWWIERLRANLRLTDRVRLDHFRGFAGFWAVPAGEATAEGGTWVEGPGAELFEAIAAALGGLPLVAEDLGVITPDVTALRDRFGLPGMKVLQFGFDPGSDHAPHRLVPHSVVYTGTHDNDTTRGWFESLDEGARRRVLLYTGGTPETISWDLLRTAYTAVAELAIAPVQDLLGLDGSARMNRPGSDAGNWGWRLAPGSLGGDLAERLAELVAVAGRLPPG